MPSEVQRCRICGETQLAPILSLGDQYLTGVFPRTPDERLTCGPLELVKCHGERSCGLVQLRHSYDLREMYGLNYGYRSGLNRLMVDHLAGKVGTLGKRVGIGRGDVVLDIGSNDGTLLSFYPEKAIRVGMDPTAEKFAEFYAPGIEIVPEFFSAETFQARCGARKAKIITSVAMFYDLERPLEFVRQIERVLDDEGIWHFEQSYMPAMLTQNAYDTICHEHLEYYGLRQVQWMLGRCGLKIIDVALNDVNGGSFAVNAAKTGSHFQPNVAAIECVLRSEDETGVHTLAPFENFRSRIFAHREQLLALLDSLESKGGRVLGYGASTKGNVILQFCGITPGRLPFIAEVNPDKFGAFTPGTKIPIISEAEAHAMHPDYLLVMPWHFRKNLIEREADYLRGGGRMIFPLPELEIVGPQ